MDVTIRYRECPRYARGKFHFAFQRIAPSDDILGGDFQAANHAFAHWCVEQFGPFGEWADDFNGEYMLFKHETDAFAFKIRWC